MRQFGPVIQPLVLAMLDMRHVLHPGRGVTLQFVGNHEPLRVTRALEELAERTFRRLLVTPTLYENVEYVAILIDCPPQLMVLALDGEHHFVEMPFVAALRLAPAQRIGISLAELERPLADLRRCQNSRFRWLSMSAYRDAWRIDAPSGIVSPGPVPVPGETNTSSDARVRFAGTWQSVDALAGIPAYRVTDACGSEASGQTHHILRIIYIMSNTLTDHDVANWK